MSDDKPLVHWPRLALLDVLRPPQGWQATDVLLSTYSLDLAVLVSGLLALSGRDTAEGSGSKVALAHAIHHFRPDGPNRLAALVQGGRIATPRSSSMVLALLDRFVCEVKQNKRVDSWHAKAALVRFVPKSAVPDESTTEWRMWIGSRNLTRDMSWDTGLVLCSTRDTVHRVEGVATMAQALLKQSGWDDKRQSQLLSEIELLQWDTPEGTAVDHISWLDGTSRWQPELPKALDELVVVTPFFDLQSLRALEQASSNARGRTLLTTQTELDRRLAGTGQTLDHWRVICLESSSQANSTFVTVADDDDTSADQWPEPLNSEDEENPIGLHAKLVGARRGKKTWLVMGSANITQRAWLRNTELMVALEGEGELWEGIEALLDLAGHAELRQIPDIGEKNVQHWLEDFRNALCDLRLHQIVSDALVEVVGDQSPSQLLAGPEQQKWHALEVRFAVAPLGSPDSGFISWPPNEIRAFLSQEEGSLAGASELLCFRLCARVRTETGKETEERLSWIQRVPMKPPPDLDRDRRIMTIYLNPRQFLSWITGMLEGFEKDDEHWSEERVQTTKTTGLPVRVRQTDLPSIEALLRAWQRDPRSLAQVADTLERYFDAKALQSYPQGENSRDVEVLERFQRQLKQMLAALGTAPI